MGARASASPNSPNRPPWRREYGHGYFKATCIVHRDGVEVCRVVGYDRYVDITLAVEAQSAEVARDHDAIAGEAQLTFLDEPRKYCNGHIYLIEDDQARKLTMG